MPEPAVEALPLSAQQRRIWRLSAAGPGRGVGWCRIDVDVEAGVEIGGEVDPGRLREAVDRLAVRHEILRTAFVRRPGLRLPFQAVADSAPSWQALEADAGRGAGTPSNGLPAEILRRPFDLEAGALLRAAWCPAAGGGGELLLAAPALAVDAVSLAILVDDLAAAYGELAGDPGAERDDPVQYADFAAWQEEAAGEDDEEARRGRAFWQRIDLDPLRRLAALADGPDGEGADGGAADDEVAIGAELGARVERLAATLGVADETVLFGLWALLVHRLTGVASPVIGRGHDLRPAVAELAGAVGPIARLLPVAAEPRGELPFADFVARLEAVDAEAVRWQLYADLDGGGKAAPAELPLQLEVWTAPPPRAAGGARFAWRRGACPAEPFLARLEAVRGEGGLSATLRRDPARLSRRRAETLASGLVRLAAAAAEDPGRRLAACELLADGERRRLLVELAPGPHRPAPPRAVHELFAEQARRHPERPAVVFEGETLSYGELAARAARLARLLRARGVGAESRVAILLERSAEMVVAILAALEAGGAFVPLDPAYPEERLARMLEEAAPRAVIARRETAGRLPAGAPAPLLLDELPEEDAEDLDAEAAAEAAPAPSPAGEQLAYVMFTSGSSGRPRGVAVEHRALSNYVAAVGEAIGLPPGAGYASVSTFAADLGHTAVFPALTGGGCLHVVSYRLAADPEALADAFEAHPADCLKIVPSHLGALLSGPRPESILPRRVLVLGGEALPAELAERVQALRPDLAVVNHYGPTETTVGAVAHRLPGPGGKAAPGPAAGRPPALGRPLANLRAYVVDRYRQPLPAGVDGVLLLGGAGLARGYLGRPAATAARFVPDPFGDQPGARLYDTGDRVRWRGDGMLEFRGRTDLQVKIRGYRIELGEIEAVLAEHPAVREAAATAREDAGGRLRLIAYAVPRSGADLDPAALADHLRRRLPEALVPAAVVRLESLPLTANGKVDRRALPEPDQAAAADRPYEPPRTEAERTLGEIWSRVLDRPRVGVRDNFFELGGDSILAIQTISLAGAAGILFDLQDLFRHQVLSELAAAARTSRAEEAEQGAVTGGAPLTPIQRELIERRPPDLHHFNQSLLLEVPPAVEPPLLGRLLARLVVRHDALRLRLETGADGPRQRFEPPAGALPFAVVDLAALPAAARRRAVEQGTARAQATLDLERGPILRAVAFTAAGEVGRLALVVHHLAVDAVSWRILTEDLTTLAGQALAERPLALPAKTTSFSRWAERLAEAAGDPGLVEDAGYWLDGPAGEAAPLPLDRPEGADLERSEGVVSGTLSPERTRELVQEVPAAYRTRIQEVLLTALVRTLGRWTGGASALVAIEGHGREPLFEGVDLSRTVGWFTHRYPVLLRLPEDPDPGAALRAIREQLRAVPRRGIAYGVVRYLGRDEGVRRRLAERWRPEVNFNYLGQFGGERPAAADRAAAPGVAFARARELTGPERSPRQRRRFRLGVGGAVTGGRLEMLWSFGRDVLDRETVRRLAGWFTEELEVLVARCLEVAAAPSAADFPLADLDSAGVESLAAALERIDQAAAPREGGSGGG